MRKIKFRYKIKGRDKLLYDTDDEFGYLTRERKFIAGSLGEIFMVEDEMQFIGIDDKERIDIYEKDIVIHENSYRYIVEYSEINGKFYLRQPRDKDGNCLDKVYTGGIDNQEMRRCKVMGNIYETPTLLKK